MAGGPAILYQNSSKTLTLLDIPRSIAIAQATSDVLCYKSIYSSPALEEPWSPTEPRSAKAKANVAAHGMIRGSSFRGQGVVANALEKLHEIWKADWCLERKVNLGLQEPKIHAPPISYGRFVERQRSEPLILSTSPTSPLRPCDVHIWPVQNSSSKLVTFPVEVVFDHDSMNHHATSTTYRMPVRIISISQRLDSGSLSPKGHIPSRKGINLTGRQPASTFIISDIANIQDLTANRGFRMGALALLPDRSTTTSANAGEFDFILLDPPW